MEWKDENPLISICILNRNWENRLPKSIPSILLQDYPNLEFIFLDNWSTDKSLDYISQFCEIKILKSKTNLWISEWRNKLAYFSKWEYIFFVDNDIEITCNGFIEKLFINYQSLKKKNIWVLFPISVMENEKKYCNLWLSFSWLRRYIFDRIYKTDFIKRAGFEWSAFFIEKKTFEDMWWFDDKYPICMNDSDLSMRLYNMWYNIFADTNLYTIHHWLDARTSIKNIWWKYKYYFAALMRSILKNYKMISLLKRWLISWWWIIIKAFKFSIKYKSILPLKGTIKSIIIFFRDLPDTLKQRKYWQNKRITRDDVFLKIK